MRAAWAVVLGVAVGVGVAWWFSHDDPNDARISRDRAAHAAAATAEDARPVLYRWHDANGVLQITDKPPKDRKYERIDKTAPAGIEVHGDRP